MLEQGFHAASDSSFALFIVAFRLSSKATYSRAAPSRTKSAIATTTSASAPSIATASLPGSEHRPDPLDRFISSQGDGCTNHEERALPD